MNNVLDPWDLVELGFIWDRVPPDLRSRLRNWPSKFEFNFFRCLFAQSTFKSKLVGEPDRVKMRLWPQREGEVGAIKIYLGSLRLGRTGVNMRLWPQRERELGGCDEPCRCHPHLLKGRSSVALHYIVMWFHYIAALFCITLHIETVVCFVYCDLSICLSTLLFSTCHVHMHWNFILYALCAVICLVVCQESKLLCSTYRVFFFNWPSPFSVPKRKTAFSQWELLFHEILHLRKPLVGSLAYFLFGTEQGGAVDKTPCIIEVSL